MIKKYYITQMPASIHDNQKLNIQEKQHNIIQHNHYSIIKHKIIIKT